MTPLVFKQHVPNVSENTLGASGPSEGRISRSDARFNDLVINNNPDIVFKNRQGSHNDRIMSQVSSANTHLSTYILISSSFLIDFICAL